MSCRFYCIPYRCKIEQPDTMPHNGMQCCHSVTIVLDFIQTVWIFDPLIFCLDFINKSLDFSSLENC